MHLFRNPACILALLFCFTAQAAEPDDAYNRGVQAFRVKDYATARVQWAKAVDANMTHAFNNLGFLYYMGWGGKEDVPRAIALWTTAAKRGHDESQYHLGQAYEEGTGVPRSLVQAYAWYRASLVNSPAEEVKSSSKELDKRRQALVRLLAEMQVEQLGEAERMARGYIGKYPRTGDLKE